MQIGIARARDIPQNPSNSFFAALIAFDDWPLSFFSKNTKFLRKVCPLPWPTSWRLLLISALEGCIDTGTRLEER
jgi:hypothetical protein